MKSHQVALSILALAIFAGSSFAQEVKSNEDSTKTKSVLLERFFEYQDTSMSNIQINGEFTPGKGFSLFKNDFVSLNFSMYAMVRYLNQSPGKQTWHDHLGRERTMLGRNDFYFHRSMLWFSGFMGTPNFTYAITVWTVTTTQQTLIFGNLNYKFSKWLNVGMGMTPNLGIRALQGPFPFFNSTDRTMVEDAVRPGFTNGLFIYGQVTPKIKYNFVLGNNLSILGVQASKLTRDLAKSASIMWLPTTGEFGPRGGHGDLEHHTKIATRFGVSFTHARDDRFNSSDQASPDNVQIRLSDGVLLYETGALADSVTVDKATYQLLSIDAGVKYKGFCFFGEFYTKNLNDFVANGELPVESIQDFGYTLQASYMVIKRKLNVYGVHSALIDQFNRNPYELGGGLNFYPIKTRNWRLNTQAMYVVKSAAGGTFGLYAAGQTGTTFTFGVDILL